MKNVSRLERLLTVGAKPYRILIVIMKFNAFFELAFSLVFQNEILMEIG